MRVTDLAVVHCSATPPSMDIGVKEIRIWHRQRGWRDIGYHFVIRRNGRVETGRPVSSVGAHVKGHNKNSIGICLVGGVDEDNKPQANFTQHQYTALLDLLTMLKERHKVFRIVGHNELDPNKACPSFDLQRFLTTRKVA